MKPIKLYIKTESHIYPIIIGPNIIQNLAFYLNQNSIYFNKCLLLIDKRVPKKMVSIITKSLKRKKIYRLQFNASEKNKNLNNINKILQILLDKNLHEMSERTEALLMTASRSQLTYEKILKNLKEGKNIISDRYSDSTLAYQGGGRDINLDWLINLNNFATFSLEPDITFLIDLHPAEAVKRKNIQQDRIESAGIAFQEKVRNSYLKISKRFQNRIVLINGHDEISKINKKIIDELLRRNIINETII